VIGVDDEVAHPQVGEAREPAARGGRRRGAAAVDEAAERDHRQPQLRRDEAVAQRRLGEEDGGIGRDDVFEEPRLDPVQVVSRALGLALALEGDDGAVARTQLLLQLRLGLPDRARG
jgi:hypothetical protein